MNGGGILFIVLTLVQISPIKINPWSSLARLIGRTLNGDVMDKLDKSEADSRRYRILRFDDEIRHKQNHTKEHFDQILDDITEYGNYCSSHPNYENDKAVLAIENIRETYKKCRDNNSFL